MRFTTAREPGDGNIVYRCNIHRCTIYLDRPPAPFLRRRPMPQHPKHPFPRRDFLGAGLALAGGLTLPAYVSRAFAEDHPPVGTWPAGIQGKQVSIGIAVPRTGTYAEQGEDELKGWQLAVEHINGGHDLIRQISPRTKKGVLGKE